MAGLLDYNNARNQYVAKPNVLTYNNALTAFNNAKAGNVMGVSTSSGGQNTGGGAPAAAAPAASQGGGGGQPPMQQAPAQPSIDFDALIRPALDALSAYEPTLQNNYDTNVNNINSASQTQMAGNKANIDAQSATLNQAKGSQTDLATSAADEARRQYSEIQQGLQARYGGTSGTGAFAGELVGRQTQQNIGKIRQGLSDAMLQIDNKLQQVQEVGRVAQLDIQDRTSQQIAQAKQQLDASLQDIRNQKGALMAHKAELAANAVQVYQQAVNNTNAQNTAFLQNLYLQQKQAEQSLQTAQQKAQGIAGSYTPTDFSSYSQTSTPVSNTVQTQNTNPSAGGSLNGTTPGATDTYDQLLKQYGLGQ